MIEKLHLSHDVASGSEITPCNKIDKPLVVMDGTCASQGCVPNKKNTCPNLWDWFYASEQQIVWTLMGAALCGAPSGSSLFARVGN